jgi:hypothetical protein
MTPMREAMRLCRPKNIRSAPPALRRGLLLHVIETHLKNRRLYIDVVSGNI